MAHVLDLTTSQKAVLYSPHVPIIGVKVIMKCLAKVATVSNSDGTYTFSSSYSAVTIDLSSRVKVGRGIRISTIKPIAPTGKGNSSRGANVQIALINHDEYFATTQDGAILSPDNIQDAHIDIYSTFGGEELLMYTGRVVGRPTEKFGETILTLQDSMKSIVDIPIPYYGISNGTRLYFDAGQIKYKYHTSSTGRLETYHATTFFNDHGRIRPAITNNEPTKVDLSEVIIRDSMVSPASKYVIKFTGKREYTVVFPTKPPEIGSVDEDFDKNNLKIDKDFWRIPGDNKKVIDVSDIVLEDLTGTEIEIYSCLTFKGNPISVAKELLLRAFNLGKSVGGVIAQTKYPVDWDTFDELEKMYSGTTIFVSETNKDPKVYDPSSSQRPISYKNMIERVLEHVGCFLCIDSNGRITAKNRWLLEDQETHEINSDMIEVHEFIGNLTKYEQLRVKYGQDLISGTYYNEAIFSNIEYETFTPQSYPAGSVVYISDILYIFVESYNVGDNITEKWRVLTIDEYQLNFPYFKTGQNDRDIKSLSCSISKYIFNQHTQILAKVLPNHGLPLEVGDKVKFSLTIQPKKSEMYAEIFSVNKLIGGAVVIKAVLVDKPEHPKELCETVICTDKIY